MKKAKGVSLGQLMGRAAEQAIAPAEPITAPVRKPATPRTRASVPSRAVQKPLPEAIKQLNVHIPEKLYRKVKAKASLEGKALGVAVEEVLEGWVG